jgi:hypothetical protein
MKRILIIEKGRRELQGGDQKSRHEAGTSPSREAILKRGEEEKR